MQFGEKVVTAEQLEAWEITVPSGLTVTRRPDRIDGSVTPLSFDPGTYSAHDHDEFLRKRLSFIVVVAEVFDGRRSLGKAEAGGIVWRHHEPLADVGYADLDVVFTDTDWQMLVVDAVDRAIRAEVQ
ncbi:hypothetical protein CF165_09195 [Amycolatopsis vastitatis]|uniref:Uncharacterized protein n=1 Tax=Amycolatopsis vastitatis TaxID=1905142 RepID=A0A229TFI1_9PSEU|nr:hypothetical protein CF165_09195 [Amycolatopsis vastitatis]